MAGQWRVRVAGTQREAVDIELLIQAVVALGRQLAREEQGVAADEAQSPDPVDDLEQGA